MCADGVSRARKAASSPVSSRIASSFSPGSPSMVRRARDCCVMVSWIFLGLAVWGALWTLISFRPPHRPGWLMVVGFFAAWSTTELAPFHLVWQLVVVIVLVLLGALDSWPGWVALAITLVSWFGLASSVKGALETDRVFADAMRDALGPEWDAQLDPMLAV